MAKIGVTLSDETAQRLREYTVKAKGSLRGQSEVVEEAVVEFLERHKTS
jgi:predicted transcriptional regulator